MYKAYIGQRKHDYRMCHPAVYVSVAGSVNPERSLTRTQ